MFSHIYLIRNEENPNIAKIGHSSEPIKRLSELQTGNSSKLYLAACFYVRNPKGVEKALHYLLDPKRLQGEWFDLPREYNLPVIALLSSMSLHCRCKSCYRKEWQ